MNTSTTQADSANDDAVGQFSHAHAGIVMHLDRLAALPALLGPARMAQDYARRTTEFFRVAVFEHHKEEEEELFPAVLSSATPGEERELVATLIEALTTEHRLIEGLWRQLEPDLKKIAKGQSFEVDARLLEDLLDISRIGSGRIALDRREVDLKRVLEEAIEMTRPLIDSRRHALEVAWPEPPLTLWADPLRLSQVFANLLTNAAKYTDPGGRIGVRVDSGGGEVRVHIRDSGIGLDAQDLDKVFQRFAQVRGATDRSQGGLGIGLSLVRGLVRLHGGWVRAYSEGPGKGSEFVVGLPLRARPAI